MYSAIKIGSPFRELRHIIWLEALEQKYMPIYSILINARDITVEMI